MTEVRRSSRAIKPVTTYAAEYQEGSDSDNAFEPPSTSTANRKVANAAARASMGFDVAMEGGLTSTDDELDLSAAFSSDPAPSVSLKNKQNGKKKAPVAPAAIIAPRVRTKPHGYDYSHYLPGGSVTKEMAKVKAAELDSSANTITLSTGQTCNPPHGVIYEVPKGQKASKPKNVGPPPEAREPRRLPRVRDGQPEERAERYIDTPPDEYAAFLQRATTQKMFILERTRSFHYDCHANHEDCPREDIELAGSKGDVYTVVISHLCTCNCPSQTFRSNKSGTDQCKHIIYVLHHVLKAPENLKYQAAFLTSELKEIFAAAPPIRSAAVPGDIEDTNGNRKPVEEGDECPICCVEFEEAEKVVWCKAACGNNVHEKCFKMWAMQKTPVKCPFCRTEWVGEEADGQGQTAVIVKVKKPA